MYKDFKSNGFSGIELAIVIAVLSIFSAVAIPAFNCVRRRAISTAAQETIRQIKEECETNYIYGIDKFTSSNPNKYQISASGSNSCSGGTVTLTPEDTNLYPTYLYKFSESELSYNFKGQTGTSFVACNKLICGDSETSEINLDYEFVMKDSYYKRECSAYVVVDGPTWVDAEANAVILGGHLVTINDAKENTWIMNTFKKIGDGLTADQWGAKSLFIGLTRSDESGEKIKNKFGHSDGWISGESSDYRPDYWGEVEGKDWDGNSGAIVWHQGGAEEGGFSQWNDFPSNRHTGKGLVEIPICN